MKLLIILCGLLLAVCVQVGSGCDDTEFQCNNLYCMPGTWVCDGYDDCGDGSDEAKCCGSTRFKCGNGNCIIAYWVCDSYDDCGDNSDENVCGCHTGFMCDNGNCVPFSWVCDGVDDCDDNSDEAMDCGMKEDFVANYRGLDKKQELEATKKLKV